MYCPYMYIFTYVQTTGAADAGSPPKKSLGDDSLGFELPTPSPQQQQDMLKSGLSTFGYDCNFVDPPPKRLECPICLLTLRMPHVTSCCGNHFCQPCIDPLCKPSPPNSQSVCVSQRPCPICQEPRFSVMLHKGLMREVNELKVFCANRNLGCGWSGELGSLRKHLDPSSAVFSGSASGPPGGCQYEVVSCSVGCGERIQRRLLSFHEGEQCPRRPVTCSFCGKYKSFHFDVVHNHHLVCESYPVSCLNECGVGVQPRSEMKKHVENECPLQLLECDFRYAGCRTKLKREDFDRHMSEKWKEHISLLSALNARLLEEKEEKIQRLASAVVEKSEQIERLSNAVSRLTQVCEGMQLRLNPVPPFDFTITDVSHLKKNDLLFHSPPFYSHMGGYKLSIRVRVNGGQLKGWYMSVYLFMMRGEYDDDLEWPFKGSVTIQLLNVQDKTGVGLSGHREVILDCKTIAESRSPFKRVTEYEMPDWGCGVEEFISHDELFRKSGKSGQTAAVESEYIANDCAHFRVPKVEL